MRSSDAIDWIMNAAPFGSLPQSDTAESAIQVATLEAEKGSYVAIEAVAAFYSNQGPYRNIEKAYFWQFILKSFDPEGEYLTDIDLSGFYDSGGYCGPVGDFRNEPEVSDLLELIPRDKVLAIDAMARVCINTHKIIGG